MPYRRDGGSAFITDLIVAALVVSLVAAVTSAYGAAAHTTELTREAARSAAVTAARTGRVDIAEDTARRVAAPGSSISVTLSPDAASVTVASDTVLPHPVLQSASLAIRHTVEVPVAPYRSNRG